MLDCKIDVLNKEDAITIEEVKSEFIRFYYRDSHHVYNKLLLHFLGLLNDKLVKDAEGNVLDENSPSVKEFMDMEEVKFCQTD